MKFGYFTLSDNHYDNNIRTPNDFVANIIDEAAYAEEAGLHSAWIGGHHFSTLVCFPARIWYSPMSRRGRARSGWLPPSPCYRCITRSASPSNGRHSIC
jgi:alkanesulfonate monooxygenase SsuD/methylene tetrahydromethanopterin reductase-like flavin-dependent oxidoreductase (luciferase family)